SGRWSEYTMTSTFSLATSVRSGAACDAGGSAATTGGAGAGETAAGGAVRGGVMSVRRGFVAAPRGSAAVVGGASFAASIAAGRGDAERDRAGRPARAHRRGRQKPSHLRRRTATLFGRLLECVEDVGHG